MKEIVDTTYNRNIKTKDTYVRDYFTYYDNGFIFQRNVRNCLDGFTKKGYLYLHNLNKNVDKKFMQVYVENTVSDSLLNKLLDDLKTIFSNADTYAKASARAKLLGLNSSIEFNNVVIKALKYDLAVYVTYDDFSGEKYSLKDGYSTIFICNKSELNENELIFGSIKAAFKSAKRNNVIKLDDLRDYKILVYTESDSYSPIKPIGVSTTTLELYVEALFDETAYAIFDKIGIFLNESEAGNSCRLLYEINGEKNVYIDYFKSNEFLQLDDASYEKLLRRLRRNGGFFIKEGGRIRWC